MKRRGLIAGIGAAVAGAGGMLGTGAFTSVNADRMATVAVADESDSFLAIFPSGSQPNATFATADSGDGEIALDFNNANDTWQGTPTSSQGVGVDSTYIFDDVFRIENQGTQDVYVDITSLIDVPLQNGSGNPGDVTLEFIAKDGSGNRTVIDGTTADLTVPVGGQRPVGVRIVTDDESTYGNVNNPTDNNTTQGEMTTIVADTDDSGTTIDPGTPNLIVNP
ncbi:Protein of unknown function [Halorubrum aquaticum]|uniref:DUF1102 domain-containing protein n=1 Tax=Halorubrum aquaticum TaxID=387340 RepID=A0A1I3ALB8_9EURY|nr:DUF1102 domain-containing protein [Halorubrum aquaticum]SFH50606.1 Protein of unknown function [Halorubrum aquaticum]